MSKYPKTISEILKKCPNEINTKCGCDQINRFLEINVPYDECKKECIEEYPDINDEQIEECGCNDNDTECIEECIEEHPKTKKCLDKILNIKPFGGKYKSKKSKKSKK